MADIISTTHKHSILRGTNDRVKDFGHTIMIDLAFEVCPISMSTRSCFFFYLEQAYVNFSVYNAKNGLTAGSNPIRQAPPDLEALRMWCGKADNLARTGYPLTVPKVDS